ncbi:unnamed protein product, partial [Acanthoscelides obtectus]
MPWCCDLGVKCLQ